MAAEPTLEIVAVILVDRTGRLLLQLRDQHAPVHPDLWSLVGGRLEPGENHEDAARRELLEETGLTVGELELVYREDLVGASGPGMVRWNVYAGPTHATDADIVVGEGADMVFQPAAEVRGLELSPPSRHFLELFLDSEQYQRCLVRR